jgi:CHAT domain-containing protein
LGGVYIGGGIGFMRCFYLILCFCSLSFYGKAQTLNFKEIFDQFQEAVKLENDEEIISKGTLIIEYIENNNSPLSKTSEASIRLFISSSYQNKGDFKKALELNLQTLEKIEFWYSENKENKFFAMTLYNISINYSSMGDHFKAIEIGYQALGVFEKVVGKEDHLYAHCLNSIALEMIQNGDFNSALDLNLQVLVLFEKVYGKDHRNYATGLANLAITYSYLGEYSKALEINLQSLYIREKILTKEDQDYVNSLHNIANVYSDLGEYSKALEYNLQASAITEKTLGKEHPEYAMSLSNIAMDYSNLGEYIKSLEINKQVLVIREKTLGKEHPDYATSLNNIALNYYAIGQYSNSLEYNLKALTIYEKAHRKEHPNSSTNLNNIALNYYDLRDYPLASKYFKESYSTKEKSFRNNQFGLNNNLISTYKKSLENSLFVNAGMLSKDTTNAQFIATSWLNLNGLLASNQKNLEQGIISSGDSLAIAMMYELKLNNQQLHKYQELTRQEKQKRGIDEAALKEKIDAQERDLSQKSKSFANFNRYFKTGDVSNNLKSNEYFIDIVRAPHFNFTTKIWTDSTQYLVFIYSSQDTVVQYLFIQDGFGLEGDALENYKAFTSGEYRNEQNPDPLSYERFWLPIAEKIGNAKTIYVSSNGIYNKINLNILYNPETGNYLIEEKDIRIVNSARDFVLSKEREKKPYTSTTSALYGFPDFNGNTTKTVDSTYFLASTRDLHKMWIDSLTRGGMKASSLPATKVEVEQIAGTFQKNGWNVKTYTGEAASETNIKLEVSPRVLHVATHGYFFEDIPMDKSNDRFLGMDRQRVVQDPMLRSGLLFTGANKTLQGEKVKGENGLLSAAEASLLDLRETELVVLSACETGKGEVKNSEGVFGLRKAFSDAGAQNIIMSLWKVDDKVTQEFMSRFYEIWLNEKTTIRDAFNRTQLEIKAKYPQPYYWGAFILVGE